ncbi:hypothetical protein LTR84_003261 [Exophiala bonariae]|uniref:NACHT domain-containing protein n=1 Tax=Exophiala bonariae TaxID=1690606 RepID=A0AAV9N891_9EURO|nr:hypothetical protein LTR84_003261 [Exophiala bonariae]
MSERHSLRALSDGYVVVEEPAPETINDPTRVTSTSKNRLNASPNDVPVENLQKLRDWLCPTNYDANSSDLRKHLAARTDGTCHWLRTCVEFQQWYHSSTTILLWIEGVPGAGKSVLCSHHIEYLQNNDSGPVLYFFFRRTINANKTPIAMVRDWACQLLPHSTSLARGLHNEMVRHPTVTTVPFQTLWDLFIIGIANTPKAYCIIDALDELEPGSEYLYQKLNGLVLLNPAKTKVMVTTRQLDYAECLYTGIPYAKIRLRPQNTDRDIAAFVQCRSSSFDFLKRDGDTRRQLCRTVCTLSRGLFLYAKLAIAELREKAENLGKDWLISSLSDIPKGIENMYASILNEQRLRTGVSLQDQLAILTWVTHVIRPLRPPELAAMLTMQYAERAERKYQFNMKDTVKRACGPLLETLPDGTIQVIHYSLTEYLTDQKRALELSHTYSTFPVIDSSRAHLDIASTCIRFLSLDCFLPIWIPHDIRETSKHARRTRSRQFSFLEYTATNCFKHARLCEPHQNELFSLLDAFMLPNPDLLRNWLALYRLHHQSCVPSRFGIKITGSLNTLGPLHTAALLGLTSYAAYLLGTNRFLALDEADEWRTPLSYAADEGHVTTVDLLLKHSSVNVHSNIDQDPFDYACLAGHVDVVKLLLSAGADPHLPTLRCGRQDCACLSRGDRFFPRSPSRSYDMVIKNGHTQVIRELASHPWQVLRYGNANDTFLHAAARYGRLDIVTFLLEDGRTPTDSRNSLGFTPLYEAAYYWESAIVKVLLALGACVNDTPTDLPYDLDDVFAPIPSCGATLLHALTSTLKGSEDEEKDGVKIAEVSQLIADLVGAGADANARDPSGKTPLHHASMKPSCRYLVKVLLEAGADLAAADNLGNQPLHVACPEVMPLLIAAGADPNARRNDGQTPLHLRVAKELGYGYSKTIEMLLDAGADVDLQDGEGNTSLMMNRRVQKPALYGQLFSRAVRLNTKNYYKDGLLHVLHETVFLEYSSTIEDWLRAGVLNLNDQNEDGETALFVSTMMGHTRKAELLLEHGADPQVKMSRGRSVLHAIAANFSKLPCSYSWRLSIGLSYKFDLLNRFLEAGLDVSALSLEGDTALMELARSGWSEAKYLLRGCETDYHVKAIRLLAERGTPLSTKNTAGQTCLHLAASSITEFHPSWYSRARRKQLPLHAFLEFGLNVDAQDDNGNTPLHSAAVVNASTGRNAEYHISALLENRANPGIVNNDGKTPLHMAAESGQCGAIDVLLDRMWANTARDQHDRFGNTALHYAVLAGKLVAVRSLLRACANHSLRNKNGDTALDIARKDSGEEYCKTPEIIAVLQENETRDHSGQRHENDEGFYRCESIAYLLQAGADVEALDENGATAFETAVHCGDMEMARMLLAHGAQIKNGWHNPLYAALETQDRHIDMIDLLIQEGARADEGPVAQQAVQCGEHRSVLRSILKDQAREGSSEILNLLLSHGADINETDDEGCPLIHWVARVRGDLSLLLKASPDLEKIDGEGRTALLVVCAHNRQNKLSNIRELIAAGSNATVSDSFGNNAIHLVLGNTFSSAGYDPEIGAIVQELLEASCPPFGPDQDGYTPLYKALRNGHFPLAAKLVEAGADMSCPGPLGDNALHHLARFISRYPPGRRVDPPRPTFMPRFLQAGADMNGGNLEGETPLFYAVESEFTKEHFQLYIDSGADIRVVNKKGQGLLHAIAQGCTGKPYYEQYYYIRKIFGDRGEEVQASKFKLLLDAGLDPYLEDHDHRTPLDDAAASGYDSILRFFSE